MTVGSTLLLGVQMSNVAVRDYGVRVVDLLLCRCIVLLALDVKILGEVRALL